MGLSDSLCFYTMVFCPNREILVVLGDGIMEKLIGCLNFLCDLSLLLKLLRVALVPIHIALLPLKMKIKWFPFGCLCFRIIDNGFDLLLNGSNVARTYQQKMPKLSEIFTTTMAKICAWSFVLARHSRIYYSSCFITLRIFLLREWWKIFLFTCLSWKTCLEI